MITYGAGQSITITPGSLADTAARQSAGFGPFGGAANVIDLEIYGYVTLAAGAPANMKWVELYLNASSDGTNWGDNASGSDAALTLRSPSNWRLLSVIKTPDSGGLTYYFAGLSAVVPFSGRLPYKLALAVSNQSGLALAGFAANYKEFYYS